MDNTTQAGNVLIAEFDGKKFKPYNGNNSYDVEFETYVECQQWIEDNHLEKEYKPELGWNVGAGKYHTSWDWLMPVCKKLRHTEPPKGRFIKWEEKLEAMDNSVIQNYEISEVWPFVVDFIQCINTQSKTTNQNEK